jgi:enoyl-CoA hydratase/carnithine racemase
MRSIKLLSFDEYKDKYGSARMKRDRGILEVTFHTDGGSLQWSERSHHELGMIFKCLAADRDNRIVIMTGTGDDWSGPPAEWDARVHKQRPTPEEWDDIIYFGRQLSMNMLEIEVPVIFALNGPPHHHAELPLLADIVIASENAVFGDVGHFRGGALVPGDGITVVLSALLGPNRARYLQLMGQQIDARRALDLGLVGEVLPREKVLERAREIADRLAANSDLVLRYTRLVFTQPLKEQMLRYQGFGLALEGLAATGSSGKYPTPPSE